MAPPASVAVVEVEHHIRAELRNYLVDLDMVNGLAVERCNPVEVEHLDILVAVLELEHHNSVGPEELVVAYDQLVPDLALELDQQVKH